MQTHLADFIRDTPEGKDADSILRACVHCGFCTATCPTYQLLGDELDSPRGRIYLMKEMLEGAKPGEKTRLHLDRCLTCRACETICPSGVRYGRLVDIGRGVLDREAPRPLGQRLTRGALRFALTRPRVFTPLLRMGQASRRLLPSALARKIPARQKASRWPPPRHARKMLVLDGCVQPAFAPNINAATARVLDRLGISLVRAKRAGCCGAISYHLGAHDEALGFAQRNVRAWHPYRAQGAEAIVSTASGCGVMVKEYGHLLSDELSMAEAAKRVSESTRDISEVLLAEKDKIIALVGDSDLESRESLTKSFRRGPAPAGSKPGPESSRGLNSLDAGFRRHDAPTKLAFHSPCTLQHGLKIRGAVEELLTSMGYELTFVPDAHLCCGSAGTYSILQPKISKKLLANKIAALESGAPDMIVTANIGCLLQLQSAAKAPVRHWIEVLDELIEASAVRQEKGLDLSTR